MGIEEQRTIGRRDFLKGVCHTCGIAAIIASAGLEGCAPTSKIYSARAEGDLLRIPLSEFGAERTLVVSATELPKDLLLLRTESGAEAHLMECTHRSQPLILTGERLYCQAHGSAFSLEGEVLNGPATRPLQEFPAEISGEDVIVRIG